MRTANDLDEAALREALGAHPSVEDAAAALRVSVRALKLRLAALGITDLPT